MFIRLFTRAKNLYKNGCFFSTHTVIDSHTQLVVRLFLFLNTHTHKHTHFKYSRWFENKERKKNTQLFFCHSHQEIALGVSFAIFVLFGCFFRSYSLTLSLSLSQFMCTLLVFHFSLSWSLLLDRETVKCSTVYKYGSNLLLICKRQHYVNARVHLFRVGLPVFSLFLFVIIFFFFFRVFLLWLHYIDTISFSFRFISCMCVALSSPLSLS